MAKYSVTKSLETGVTNAETEAQIKNWVDRFNAAGDYNSRVMVTVDLLTWARREIDGPEIAREVFKRREIGDFLMRLLRELANYIFIFGP